MANSTTPADLQITPRPLATPLWHLVPKYWLAGNPHYTHFMNILSMGFPVGEGMFAAAVRRFQDEPVTPMLRQQIKLFLAQEGSHGVQHTALNRKLAANGPEYGDLIAESERQFLHFAGGYGRHENLAMTVGLEHLTAVISDALLRSPVLLSKMHPEVRRLWIWHAIEEIEHKGVAFDLYQAVGGSYLLRLKMYLLGCWRYTARSFIVHTEVLKRDKQLFNYKSLLAYLWMYAGPGGLLPKMALGLLAFLKPGFHPWQHDNRALIQRWQSIIDQRY